MNESSLTTLFYGLLIIMILVYCTALFGISVVFLKTYFTVDGLYFIFVPFTIKTYCMYMGCFGDHIVLTTRIFKTDDFKLDHRNLKVLCIIFKRTKTPLIN